MFCPQCNRFYASGKFCPEDGARLVEDPTPPLAEDLDPDADTAQSSPAELNDDTILMGVPNPSLRRPKVQVIIPDDETAVSPPPHTNQSPPSDPANTSARILNGLYQLDSVMGAGAMGEVYRGFDGSGRPVAIKLLDLKGHDPMRFADRLKREAETLAKLRSPHTVRVIDANTTEDGVTYLVTELLEGETLAEFLKTHGPLGMELSLHITRQILTAIEEAHKIGVVHRDLKPANIFVTRLEHQIHVKVLDFGIAKLLNEDGGNAPLTAMGMMLGTPTYMAPEQIRSEAITPAADLYSVGTVLYECLTGAPPFPYPEVGKVMRAQLKESPRPIEAPRALQSLVAQLLEKDSSRRPNSAREVLKALDAILGATTLPTVAQAPLKFITEDMDHPIIPPTKDMNTNNRNSFSWIAVLAVLFIGAVSGTVVWMMNR